MGVRLVVPVTLPPTFLAHLDFFFFLMPEFKSYFHVTTRLHQLLCTNHSSVIDMQELCLGQTLVFYLLELPSL